MSVKRCRSGAETGQFNAGIIPVIIGRVKTCFTRVAVGDHSFIGTVYGPTRPLKPCSVLTYCVCLPHKSQGSGSAAGGSRFAFNLVAQGGSRCFFIKAYRKPEGLARLVNCSSGLLGVTGRLPRRGEEEGVSEQFLSRTDAVLHTAASTQLGESWTMNFLWCRSHECLSRSLTAQTLTLPRVLVLHLHLSYT